MNPFPLVKGIKVGLDFGKDTMPVGHLAMRERTIYFAYDSSFISQGLEISPFMLPLKEGVTTFSGCLFTVFEDSLPDGWGNLLSNV